MFGIGIDTGGTYTDGVIYNFNTKEVLASKKSLTTKSDLKVGIHNVLGALPKELLGQCQSLSLSTTLATNACVENKGGKGKLIFIGLNPSTFEESYADYGIDSLEDVYLLECTITPNPDTCTEPDWERFRKDLKEFKGQCSCVSLVQLFARQHHGSYEKKAAQIVEEVLGVSTILGHDLFQDLNVIRRGAGALLNARLIPIIHEFLAAIKEVFRDYGLALPPIIVRSDGSLMSEEYTCQHPVETLLCGPAASIIGAVDLSHQPENALIVDMGGTTTDIAIIQDHKPKRVEDGIQIGEWKTFVKGLFIDTFALGGDTAVHYNFDGDLYLEKYRVIPLCSLACTYPQILEQLKDLSRRISGHSLPLHEFFVLNKNISEDSNYTEEERTLCDALQNGPLIFEEAAKAIGRDVYAFHIERLEKEGIVLRCGLTPTDIMHIRGDFSAFDKTASLAAAQFVANYSGKTIEEISALIYDLVKERLYCNLVRILMQHEYSCCHKLSCSEDFDHFVHCCYKQICQEKNPYYTTLFHTKAKLVGVGAPTHLFLPEVARMLGTEAILPKYASVANAVGAIVGNISATAKVELRPIYTTEDCFGYEIITPTATFTRSSYEEACQLASKEAKELAIQRVREQGAGSHISTSFQRNKKEADTRVGTVLISEIISVTATGKVS